MAAIKNVMEKIQSPDFVINQYYDATIQSINEIRDNSPSLFDAVYNAFKFGYLQGGKAAKTEMKGVKR